MTDTMPARTLEFLEASIKDWEWKRNAVVPANITVGGTFCLLCVLFAHEGECLGCPIYDAGFKGCKGTPWAEAKLELTLWKMHPNRSEVHQRWKDAAQVEIDFLKSLLPKETE